MKTVSMTPRLVAAIFATNFFAANLALTADIWKSTDGKEITADFVKMDVEGVTLSAGKNVYMVPLERLSGESRAYAEFLQSRREEWVTARLALAIIPEAELKALVEIAPEAVQGRVFLVESLVERVSTPGGLGKRGPGAGDIELRGGTESPVDFTAEVDGRKTKVQFTMDGMQLMKARKITSDGPRNFTPEKMLIKVGDTVVIRAEIQNSRIAGLGIAPTGDVTAAQMKAAVERGGVSAAEYANLERMRNRIAFLEDALRSGEAGTSQSTVNGIGVGTVFVSTTYRYTDAEKASMKSELDLLKAQMAAAGGQ